MAWWYHVRVACGRPWVESPVCPLCVLLQACGAPKRLSMTHASAGSRTRVTSMATMHSTTRPLMLVSCVWPLSARNLWRCSTSAATHFTSIALLCSCSRARPASWPASHLLSVCGAVGFFHETLSRQMDFLQRTAVRAPALAFGVVVKGRACQELKSLTAIPSRVHQISSDL